MSLSARSSQKSEKILLLCFVLLFFAIPFEHKYDKFLRHYSHSLIPPGVIFPAHFEQRLLFYASDLLVLILFSLGIYWQRLNLFVKESWPLFFILGCALFSIALSPLANYPTMYTRLWQLFTPFALFTILASLPLSSERLFNGLSKSLIAAGLIESLIAMGQYFTQKNLGLRFLGEQALNAAISVPQGHLWIFNSKISDDWQIYRAMGTLSHPNILGGFLALSLLFTGYLFWKTRSKWLLVAYPIQVFALLISFSRSAFFAWLIASFGWFFWMKWRQKRFPFSLALLLVGSSLTGGVLLQEQLTHRGGVVNYNSAVEKGDAVRHLYHKFSLELIRKHPLQGIGYGQFSLISPSYDPRHPPSAVHNIFLLLASELGLPALVAFAIWIWMILRKAASSSSAEVGFLTSVLLGLFFIGCCDFYPIVAQEGKLLLFGISGLLMRHLRSDKQLDLNVSQA